jgi:hypothetical protein
MSEIPLNKFEKRELILRLLKEGKTYREVCHIAHTSPSQIKPISKEYERKKRLETKKGEKTTRTKKPSISTQTFILFKEGKKIDEAKVLLDIPFKLAIRYWAQYLKSIRMFESFEFYQDHSYDIPTLLSINTFMKRNNISGKDIVNVLRSANDVINLNNTISNLKSECETWQRVKNNHDNAPLEPLPKINQYYTNYHF